MAVKLREYKLFNKNLESILGKKDKIVVNTINAHSYIVAKRDQIFKKALVSSDILLPDGEGIVLMAKKLKNQKLKKIAGADLHEFLVNHANAKKLKCFYLGSSQQTLDLIENKLSKKFPYVQFGFYSPPFKSVFSNEDNDEMIRKVNDFSPNILFIGMTAPKQEKWVYKNKEYLNANVICSIGAVFDFIAETKKRAPNLVINSKLEWLYRSLTEWRLTKRYLYSTPLFLIEVFKLKFFPQKEKR